MDGDDLTECGERWEHDDPEQWPHKCTVVASQHDLRDHRCCCGAIKETTP